MNANPAARIAEGLIGVAVVGVVLLFFAGLYVVALPLSILWLPFDDR